MQAAIQAVISVFLDLYPSIELLSWLRSISSLALPGSLNIHIHSVMYTAVR